MAQYGAYGPNQIYEVDQVKELVEFAQKRGGFLKFSVSNFFHIQLQNWTILNVLFLLHIYTCFGFTKRMKIAIPQNSYSDDERQHRDIYEIAKIVTLFRGHYFGLKKIHILYDF